MLNVSLRSTEIPQSFRHPQVSGTISGQSMKGRCGVWAGNFPVVLTICLPENGAGAGAQRINLLEVNSPFKSSTINGKKLKVNMSIRYIMKSLREGYSATAYRISEKHMMFYTRRICGLDFKTSWI